MTNEELIQALLTLSQEHLVAVLNMVNQMNAHSTKKVVYRLREPE